MKSIRYKVMFILLSVMLTACTSQEDRQIERQARLEAQLTKQAQLAEMQLNSLKNHINSGMVKNIQILKLYGERVKQAKPEFAQLVDALTKDATPNGPTYLSLEFRLNDVKINIPRAAIIGESASNKIKREMVLIEEAATPALYNMILTDPINVLADMSDGKLARVEAMSKEAMKAAGGGTEPHQGSQLVGNPSYGHWQNNNNGQVWMWLAAYSMFSNLHRPVYYNNWSTGRHYSYYHDVGRSHYTSPSQYKQQQTSQSTARAKFQKQGKAFASPYAKTRAGATSTTVRPKSSNRSSNFKSSYSSSNSSLSSVRNTSSRTSRGRSGGK